MVAARFDGGVGAGGSTGGAAVGEGAGVGAGARVGSTSTFGIGSGDAMLPETRNEAESCEKLLLRGCNDIRRRRVVVRMS